MPSAIKVRNLTMLFLIVMQMKTLNFSTTVKNEVRLSVKLLYAINHSRSLKSLWVVYYFLRGVPGSF